MLSEKNTALNIFLCKSNKNASELFLSAVVWRENMKSVKISKNTSLVWEVSHHLACDDEDYYTFIFYVRANMWKLLTEASKSFNLTNQLASEVFLLSLNLRHRIENQNTNLNENKMFKIKNLNKFEIMNKERPNVWCLWMYQFQAWLRNQHV